MEAEDSQAAERLARGLDELKGGAMKLGQLLGMQSDLLPPAWQAALSRLQSNATAVSFDQIQPVLEASIPMDQFRSLNPVAVHAASVGQVHRGELLCGTQVAVKIRYPGLAEHLDEDFAALKTFLRLSHLVQAQGSYDHVFREVRRILQEELDFTKELGHYELYRTHLSGHPSVFVPKTFPELSADGVLTTEWVDGVNIDRWLKTNPSQGARDTLGQQILELLFSELFLWNLLQTDPNPGNFLVTPSGRLGLLDFGATVHLPPALMDRYQALLRGSLHRDEGAVAQGGLALGFLQEGDKRSAREAFGSLIEVIMEPFRKSPYTFGGSGLSARINAASLQFLREIRFRAPPPGIVFINRRLLGTQMFLEKLAPVLDLHRILSAILPLEEMPSGGT